MSAAPPSPATDPNLGSIEALKRVKATESDWELRLRAARGASEEAIERLRADSETAVKNAQATAESDRARTVQSARFEADRQAKEILDEGTRIAADAARGEGKRAADKKDAILAAVLAGFAKD